MAQGYYTVQEAAQYLAISVEEMKQLAQKGKIRSFQDRGTLRFRVQDIQEMARERGTASDPDQVLGDASLPPPKSSSTPPSAAKKGPRSPKSPKKEAPPEVFDFSVEGDNVDVGGDVLPKGSSKSKPPGSKGKKVPTPQATNAGSDSDVRLVADGSDVTFSVPRSDVAKHPDSDVRISPDPLKPKTGIHTPPPGSGAAKPGSGPKSKKADASSDVTHPSPKPGSAPSPVDSGVRLVPMDSDSDVKLHGSSDEVPLGESGPPAASDSSVRLEKAELPGADSQDGGMMLTEEINLDEEIKKHQELDQDKPRTKVKVKSELKMPSPFELSDSDLDLPSELQDDAGPKTPVKAEGQDSSDFELTSQEGAQDGSSDFDLVPAGDGSIVLEDSSDFSLEASDGNEEVLQEERGELSSSTSGISLDNPVDAGISLEEGGSSDFDLSLEVDDTPTPRKSEPASDTDSSEFELAVDSDTESSATQAEDSEFELNLEGSGETDGVSDSSEFELTLDDSGELGPVADEKPQVKSKKKPAAAADEQDIFDTDFEVPALEDSDEATVADSELESSDFDLALDDSELAQEEESGSQVVALDEEDADAATVADDDAAVVDDAQVEEESSDFADLDQDVEIEEDEGGEVEVEEETATKGKTKKEIVIQEKLIPAAPWGVMPVIFMLPCVVIMFLVGILGYELVQTSAGLRPPGPLTVEIAKLLDRPLTLKN